MANFLDDDRITLLCDHCGSETQAKVRILRQNQTVMCLACGVSLDYNAAEFRPRLARAKRARLARPTVSARAVAK